MKRVPTLPLALLAKPGVARYKFAPVHVTAVLQEVRKCPSDDLPFLCRVRGETTSSQ